MPSAESFTISTGTSSVSCGPEQKMLDAFLRNGVWVPNSCNQGTCGTCKVRVVHGTVDHPPAPDSVLSIAEQEQGVVLSCQTTPTSDVVIDPPTEETGSPRHVLRDIAGTVGAVTSIAADTVSVTVLLDQPLEFTAGQYVELAVPGTLETRPYSMANPPSEPDRLEFHIRRQPGGLATEGWIFESLDVGDPVTMCGPWGDFCYEPAESGVGLVLLAGGTGLAPLKAIARAALQDDPEREIHVYHGVRTRDELYDVDFWEGLSSTHPGVRYIPCLSREQWSGRTGYVGDAMMEDLPSCRNHAAYLCGPPAMVEAGVKALKRRRMSPRRIRREKYTPAVGLVPA
ncbi:2Fe-2S iron-sulfur cluster-binding protein [Gordonia rubripertincta]|uniref:2Fe-2S iron-sulfur cluster-binding protein n=2 Tax=Gordonia rubripertincta TaxID=36822 RepID=A0AAW6RJS5_GORRU|nr:2Fe-2S iron-sulfur cluster-binding protein [Gordonia rubripertincta]ASR01808.1 Phenol hydroxylase P5 protein [Gordonia rubripertincta]MDG6783439.1 2Fe-2S iron-sulfur cluster-binding protein [Gordonia rubripertincta]NKY62161.1 2Fe-2S iron-sulfur cluster binding domain-containing protein [Gordonia rubripertincta]QMU22724.1 2Fe-2S iron-sulfur cluster binding domain-containing protein [Gordonia rubripertincta]